MLANGEAKIRVVVLAANVGPLLSPPAAPATPLQSMLGYSYQSKNVALKTATCRACNSMMSLRRLFMEAKDKCESTSLTERGKRGSQPRARERERERESERDGTVTSYDCERLTCNTNKHAASIRQAKTFAETPKPPESASSAPP